MPDRAHDATLGATPSYPVRVESHRIAGEKPSEQAVNAHGSRSYSSLVFALFAAYLLVATGLYYFRGFQFISPERWAQFLFLFALALGRARAFVRDWIPFVLLLFGYEYMRGLASSGVELERLTAENHGRIQLDWLLDAERWLFFGRIPSLWLQERLYVAGDVRWYDMLAGLIYLLHFVFPLVFAFILWLKSQDHFWRFTISFVAMCYLAFVVFLILPTAPPWLANDWGMIQGLEQPWGQAFQAVAPKRYDNFDSFQLWTKASPNPVAAFPSLHAAFPWLVLLFGLKFFGRRALVFLLYNAGVWFSIVYFGLHWVVDIFAGIALATTVFYATNWIWPRLGSLPGIPVPGRISATAADAQGIASRMGSATWAKVRRTRS
jgi:membrane-associated phospholipid phosphatase